MTINVGTFVDLVTENRPLARTHLAQVTPCWGGVLSDQHRFNRRKELSFETAAGSHTGFY